MKTLTFSSWQFENMLFRTGPKNLYRFKHHAADYLIFYFDL